ncbi:MAG: tetratricopeptide repeat protein [Candidatus Kapaibacterium sp.]
MSRKKIEELSDDLQYAVAPSERMPLLEQLIKLVDPVDGKAYAHELLGLASSSSDKRWRSLALILLGNCEVILAEYPLATRHLKKAEVLLEETSGCLEQKTQLYRAYGFLANAHKGDLTAAIEYFHIALNFARQLDDQEELATTLCSFGGIYVNSGKTTEAIEVLEECLEISKKKSLARQDAEARTILSMMSINAQDWENAESYLKTSLAIFKELEDRKGEAAVYEKLGYLSACQDMIDQALDYYHQSVGMFEAIGNQDRRILVVMNIGFCYVEQGKFHQAHECMDQVIAYGRYSENNVVYAFGLIGKGDIYIGEEEWEEGISVLALAREQLNSMGASGHAYRATRTLAKAYEEVGRIQDALDCYRQIIEYERTVSSTAIRGKILTFPMRLEQQKIEEEKEIYRVQKEHLEKESERRMKELSVVSMQIAQNNELLDELRSRLAALKHANGHTVSAIDKIIQEIDSRSGRVSVWNTFERQLEMLDSEFVHKLIEQYPELTPAEVRICSLLKINMSNKEVGGLLNISDRTVDAHRRSIRKKMKLGRTDNLVASLLAF